MPENDEEFYEYLLKLSQSYDKHTFTDVYKEREGEKITIKNSRNFQIY